MKAVEIKKVNEAQMFEAEVKNLPYGVSVMFVDVKAPVRTNDLLVKAASVVELFKNNDPDCPLASIVSDNLTGAVAMTGLFDKPFGTGYGIVSKYDPSVDNLTKNIDEIRAISEVNPVKALIIVKLTDLGMDPRTGSYRQLTSVNSKLDVLMALGRTPRSFNDIFNDAKHCWIAVEGDNRKETNYLLIKDLMF